MNRGEPITWYATCPPDWSAGVVHVGRERCVRGHNWQGVRDHYLLHYICDGRGSVWASGRRFDLQRGDAFLYAPGDYLNYTADTDEPWEYIWVGFRGVHAGDLVAPLAASARLPELRMPYEPEVVALLERLFDCLRDRPPGALLTATGLLYEILGRLAAIVTATRPVRTSATDLVQEARIFVQQNYQREIDVADVVRHIGVDRSHFSRVFRASEGISLRDYLIRTRMERARRLLRETDLAVKAVASSVGYASYASFERRYRASFGVSPSHERRAGRTHG